LDSFTRPFWNSDTLGSTEDEPMATVPVLSCVTMRSSILRLTTAIVLICMMARWLPWDAKTLKPSCARGRATLAGSRWSA
jgi:hypothetical protein